MLAALAVVVMNVQVPLLPAAPFLKYDPSDVVVLIGGFALGPAEGLAIAVLKDLAYLFAHASPWEFVGVPMNLLAVVSLVWPAATFYWARKTRVRAVLALTLGGLYSVSTMALANLLVLAPFFRFMGLPVPDHLTTFVVQAIIPFNIVRCALNGVITFVIYKRVSNWFKQL
jgi:riboflavin transporter FmnP